VSQAFSSTPGTDCARVAMTSLREIPCFALPWSAQGGARSEVQTITNPTFAEGARML
jgi:hypothetical protein